MAIKQEQGNCPKCGSLNLSYYHSGIEGDSYYWKYQCADCLFSGTEWYDLVFSEHTELNGEQIKEENNDNN